MQDYKKRKRILEDKQEKSPSFFNQTPSPYHTKSTQRGIRQNISEQRDPKLQAINICEASLVGKRIGRQILALFPAGVRDYHVFCPAFPDSVKLGGKPGGRYPIRKMRRSSLISDRFDIWANLTALPSSDAQSQHVRATEPADLRLFHLYDELFHEHAMASERGECGNCGSTHGSSDRGSGTDLFSARPSVTGAKIVQIQWTVRIDSPVVH